MVGSLDLVQSKGFDFLKSDGLGAFLEYRCVNNLVRGPGCLVSSKCGFSHGCDSLCFGLEVGAAASANSGQEYVIVDVVVI